MNKRRCGTCRFWQEAGLAGSGWCHHPQRRTTSDVMIMVRRNELACRDEWSHDLWAARGQDGFAFGASTKQPPPIAPFPARRVSPATPTEIAAVVQADVSGTDQPGVERAAEDVVIGEARLVAEAEPDWTWERDDAAAAREVDTRAAIIKAREAYRERVRTTRSTELAESRSIDPEELLPPADAPGDAVPFVDLAEPAPSDSAADPGLNSSHAALPGAVSGSEHVIAESDDDFDVVPERAADFDLPRARSVDRLRRRPPVGEQMNGSHAAPPPLPRSNGISPAGVERAAAELSRRYAEPRKSGHPEWPETMPGQDVGPQPALGELAVVDQSNEQQPFFGELGGSAIGGAADDLAGDGQAALTVDPAPVPLGEMAERDDWYDRDGFALPDERWETGGEERVDDERFADEVARLTAVWPAAVSEAPEARGEPIDLGAKLWPHLPRVCRTCRDFRPAEAGGRGWCANEWAFTHRRVVDSADPMPCETSLGTWWLPVDEVWLAAADVSEHGQPTPILDAVEALGRAEPVRQRR